MKAREFKLFIRYCDKSRQTKIDKRASALLKHLNDYAGKPGRKSIPDFFEFVSSRLSVKSARHILYRMKKLLSDAYAEKLFDQDYMERFCIGAYLNITDDYLNENQLKSLIFHKSKIKPAVARSFLFCTYTGFSLRKIKKLTFADLGQYEISKQASDIINEIISERSPFSQTDLIFVNLPSKPLRSTELCVLAAWAGIDRLFYDTARNTYTVRVRSSLKRHYRHEYGS